MRECGYRRPTRRSRTSASQAEALGAASPNSKHRARGSSETGDAERRRLERDLHDGAQQGVLAVLYELRLSQAGSRETQPPPDAAAAESGRWHSTSCATSLTASTLRSCARPASRPALPRSLTSAALRSNSSRRPTPRAPTRPLDRGDGLPSLCRRGSVQNAATDADPEPHPSVAVVERGGALVATVTDDGAAARASSSTSGGLAELSDRVGMCGGALTVPAARRGRARSSRRLIPCA